MLRIPMIRHYIIYTGTSVFDEYHKMCTCSRIQYYTDNHITVKDNMHAGQTLVTLKLKSVFAYHFSKERFGKTISTFDINSQYDLK